MKLLCDISVGNRLAPNIKRKSVKSTLALCKEPKSQEFYIILFTAQNKNGTKYGLKDNIEKIFSRCVNEGKSTIQFKKPPHDIFIKADTIQLKGFLHLLRQALEGKVTEKNLTGMSGMAVTPISVKNIPQKKLYITSRSEYPVRGFPKSLEQLHINNIQRCSLDKGILNLIHLKLLDLSGNLIESLPEEINKLPCLTDLNICQNQFGKCNSRQWSWMGGHLSHTLKMLNISSNNLKYIPNEIVKLYSLVILHVDSNELTSFPSGIGRLQNLKILTASNNLISSLPGSVKRWRLQELDLTNNDYYQSSQNYKPPIVIPKPPPICSLKEYAARKVLFLRIPYTPYDLPRTLVDYLDNAQYCICGKACFETFLKHDQILLLDTITNVLNISSNGSAYIPINCCYCSRNCFVSTIRMSNRVI